MRRWLWMSALLAALPVAAEEVKAPVTGAMIFKNGVSAVRRTVDPGKAKEFELACDIVPLQGSLWFSGPVVSVVRQDAKKPVAGKYPLSNITKTYAGKTVTLSVTMGANLPDREISGEVWDPDAGKTLKNLPMHEENVWLKLANGEFQMIPRHQVRGVRFAGKPEAAPLPEKFDRRPVWRFSLSEEAGSPILIDCLSQGLSWQSAYRIELGKDNKMTLAMDAEIVNNLADLKDVPLYLASGYANFINSGSQSPMAMVQPVEEGGAVPRPPSFGRMFMNQVAMDTADGAASSRMYKYKPAAPAAFAAEATGETEDISLTDVGKVTLKKGEVCHRVLKQAEAKYERLVHWTIRAKRNAEYGRPVGQSASVPMDALRFTNPFDAPITTSPLEILDGGVVLAQVRIPWVNPKQVATVDVTRALSVTGKVVEYDVPAQEASLKRAEETFYSVERNKGGKAVSGWIAGTRYRVTEVQGEIRLKNYRKLPARMLVEQDYVGELVSAEGEPKKEVLDRTGSVNPSARLTWDLTLAGGEEKVLKYRYGIFVSY